MEYTEYCNDELPNVADLPVCPLETTASLIGSKWRLLILRDLMMNGCMRFGDLRKSVTGISQKVLTSNLRDLEDHGIVMRRVYAEVPPHVEYSLTELGQSLRPVVDTLWKWGEDLQAKARR